MLQNRLTEIKREIDWMYRSWVWWLLPVRRQRLERAQALRWEARWIRELIAIETQTSAGPTSAI